MKYYSHPDDEGMCYDFEHFQALVREEYKAPILVELMKREIGGEKWCKVYSDFVDNSADECCGAICPHYKPCNKISGRCRHLTQGFVGTGRFYLVPESGKIKEYHGLPSYELREGRRPAFVGSEKGD